MVDRATLRMNDTFSQTLDDLSDRYLLASLAVHIAQLILAIVIQGLNVYGVHLVAYTVLVYSLCVVNSCCYSPSSTAANAHHSASVPPWYASI
jgi:hypothetical protein